VVPEAIFFYFFFLGLRDEIDVAPLWLESFASLRFGKSSYATSPQPVSSLWVPKKGVKNDWFENLS